MKNVLKKIKTYNDNLLDTNQPVERAAKILIDPARKDISPLLVHLDLLKKVGIEMPNEHLLRLDQDFFRAFIARMNNCK